MASLASVVRSSLDSLADLRIDPSRCLKARSPLSKCSACLDICPVEGMQWTGKTVEVTDCINCGLCAALCPSESIVFKDFTPLKILSEVEEYLGTFDEVFIYCAKHALKSPVKQGIEVPCLGFLNWESWLKLTYNPRVKVYYAPDQCRNCQVRGGKERFDNALIQAEALSNQKIQRVSQFKSAMNKSEDLELDNDRRRFLGAVLKSFVEIPEKIVAGLTQFDEDDAKEKQGLKPTDPKFNPKYQILLEAKEIDPALEGKVKIDLPRINQGCQFCGVCTTLCPQQALKEQKSNQKFQIILNKSRCNSCRLCVDICFHQAIELKPVSLTKLSRPVTIIAEGSEFFCPNCGLPYRSAHEDKCPSCKRN